MFAADAAPVWRVLAAVCQRHSLRCAAAIRQPIYHLPVVAHDAPALPTGQKDNRTAAIHRLHRTPYRSSREALRSCAPLRAGPALHGVRPLLRRVRVDIEDGETFAFADADAQQAHAVFRMVDLL